MVLVVVSTFHQTIKPQLHRIVDFLPIKAKLYTNQKIGTLIYLIDDTVHTYLEGEMFSSIDMLNWRCIA